MNKDIRVLTTFPRHPKTIKLKRLLGTWEPIIVLWLWAAESRPTGSLSGMKPEDIAIACMWDGNPDELVLALLKVGFLHKMKNENAYVLHGWNEHNAYAANAEKRSEKARLAAMARWDRRLNGCSLDANQKIEHNEKPVLAPAPSPIPSPIPSPSLKESPPAAVDFLNSSLEKKIKYLAENNIFPKAPVFANDQIKRGRNVQAIEHAFNQLYQKSKNNNFQSNGAWGYCTKIVNVESGNYNERDAVKEAERQKRALQEMIEQGQ